MKITFDTNSLDKACRPERFPKDPNQISYVKVNNAIKSGALQGFYCETLITIEGIQKIDRAEVYGNTKIVSEPLQPSIIKNADLPPQIREFVGNKDVETFPIRMTAVQDARKPLHPEMVRRIEAAQKLGFRVLKAPSRVAAFQIEDTAGNFFLDNGTGDALEKWVDTVSSVVSEIEKRGVGMLRLKQLGVDIAASNKKNIPWYKALPNAKDIHEERAIERAFSEWADADSIAAHIAYGLDLFCTNDEAKHSGGDSILSPENKKWLSESYGVRFFTLEGIANLLG